MKRFANSKDEASQNEITQFANAARSGIPQKKWTSMLSG
jgi:hypothetical protein